MDARVNLTVRQTLFSLAVNTTTAAGTALVLGPGQVINEADISFNEAFTWNTTGGDFDVEAIAVHEFGHAMGIHHTELTRKNGRPSMYSAYFGTAGRSLETDDRDALNNDQPRLFIDPEFWPEFMRNGFHQCVHRSYCGSTKCLGLNTAYVNRFGWHADELVPFPRIQA